MSGDETKKKLRTYRLLKQDFGIESYLECINDKSIRKCISSLSISAHRLRIERGRYVRPKEEIEDRLCLSCNTVEGEVHFLVKCRKYENQRSLLYMILLRMSKQTFSVNDPDKTFLNLVTNKDTVVIKAVGKYINECNIYINIKNSLSSYSNSLIL